MKILICGAGRVARELLGQLGDGWEVTLVDKSREELERTAAQFPDMTNIHAEDASSPVVLDKAGIGEFDYVAAMTSDDDVNMAVIRHARESGARHLVALVGRQEAARELITMNAHVIQPGRLLADSLYRHLQDPRVGVTPLSHGPGTIMEVRASDHMAIVGKRAGFFNRGRSRLVGVFRRGKLVFPRPETLIRPDDALVFINDPEVFQAVCEMLECGNPHFPLAYGPGMAVLARGGSGSGSPPVIGEAMYLARNTRVKNAVILASSPDDYHGQAKEWPKGMNVEVKPLSGHPSKALAAQCAMGGVGLAVMPPLEPGLFPPLSRPAHIALADEMGRPMLVARGSVPYKRILAPFNGTMMSELALEVAVDLSRQLAAELSVAVVEQPDFLTGDAEGQWKESMDNRLAELGHIHKKDLKVLQLRGNPIREISEAAQDHDLLVIGSTKRDRGLLLPNVGENLVRNAACSVLILAL